MSEIPKIDFDRVTPPNRAYEMRRDDDNFKTPSITIYDVDYAVMYFLRNTIGLRVEQGGRMVDVPLIYGSGELWHQVQTYGYARDKNGKTLAPYAVINRTGMTEDERFKRVDTNYGAPLLQVYIGQTDNTKTRPRDSRTFENQRDLHNRTYNSNPAFDYYISVMPEFYVFEYELVLYANFMEQLNTMVQDIIVTSHFVWGDSYKFRTVVGDVSFETLNSSDGERLAKASLTLTTDARLQNEFELRRSTIQKAFSIKRVVFKTERSSFDANVVSQFPEKGSRGLSV